MGVYSGAFNKSDDEYRAQIEKRMYADKERKDLIEMKIPVHMPGVSAWTGYEKIIGQIKLKDAEYTYVRLKMSSDTMSLVCVPNSGKQTAVTYNVIHAKDIADVPVGKKSHNGSGKRALDTQYNYLGLQRQVLVSFAISTKNFNFTGSKPLSPFLETAGQPPDLSC